MFPKHLLENIAWAFNRDRYTQLSDFIASVNEHQTSLDLSNPWHPEETAIESDQITVIIEEVYDQDDEEIDLQITLTSESGSFTRAELLYELHNAVAEKMNAGYEFGDHVFFEGLSSTANDEARYACYLGS